MLGTSVNFAYDWDYWALYHKVTFDAANKLIWVNYGVTELDWKEDVYSAWKEWMRLESHTENPAVLPAIRAIGGDDITSDGSRKVGTTFFLTNGWRLKPWGGDYRLSILGNVYTEEGEPIYVPVDGDYKIVIEQTLSSLVELVTLEGTDTPGTAPTAAEVANAVWNQPALNNIGTGTFGSYLNMVKASSDLQLTEILDMKTQLIAVTTLVETLLKYEKNRTRVDQTQKRLYIYDDDGVTVLRSFDLRDFAGMPSVTQIAERVPNV